MARKTAERVDERLVDLVRGLVERGKTFSIAIEDADGPIVGRARRVGGEVRLTVRDDTDCTKWVYVPGKGLVCVEHG
jgi:hypothetical protein